MVQPTKNALNTPQTVQTFGETPQSTCSESFQILQSEPV